MYDLGTISCANPNKRCNVVLSSRAQTVRRYGYLTWSYPASTESSGSRQIPAQPSGVVTSLADDPNLSGWQAMSLVNHAPDLSRTDNRLLAALPPETLASLEQDLKRVSLSQGIVCYEAGNPIDRVYFPISGMISLLVGGRNGDIVEAGIIGREGAAGLQSGLGERRSYSRAAIQIPGRFAVISAAHFERAVSNSAPLRDLVFRYVETRWAQAQQIAACNAIHSGSPRLCRWLLQAADCTGSDHVPLTQEFLADMLGMRRTTVTLLAQELQQRGVIKYSRGKITLLDRKKLEACACDCYEALKRENLSLRIGV
jgi:CRP-like cAMP-binding protein